MNHRTTIAFSLIASLMLAGCSNYGETLEQKLAGKTPEQKRAILAQECGQEIQNGLKPDDEANIRHFENMKKICEEMTGKPVPVQGMKK